MRYLLSGVPHREEPVAPPEGPPGQEGARLSDLLQAILHQERTHLSPEAEPQPAKRDQQR